MLLLEVLARTTPRRTVTVRAPSLGTTRATRLSLVLLGLLGVVTGPAVAQPRAVPTLHASKVESSQIQLDGTADEAVWQGNSPTGGFVVREPWPGRIPVEKTSVRVVYDSAALYVYVTAEDRHPASITAHLGRRDDVGPSDWVELWLDPTGEGRSGYRFMVNARGIQGDARVSNGGESIDVNWDCIWDVEVSRTVTGWNAEFRIPFNQLEYDPNARNWGIQVVRRLRRDNEYSVLSPTPRAITRPLQYAGKLEGLQGLPAPGRFELIPYGLVGVERDRGDYSPVYRGGGDLRLGLGARHLLHLSVLPDFGQVEADPSQLNLTAFATFLPEKRQFFLDGLDLFAFPLAFRNWDQETLYYSRRIGMRPTYDLGLDSAQVLSYPRASEILGAVKFTGRSSTGTSYGVLSALLSEQLANVRVNGVESRPTVAPQTTFLIGRVRQSLDRGKSSVGFFTSRVDRSLTPQTETQFTRDATVAGFDFDLRQGNVGLVGHVASSRVAGSPEAIDALQRSAPHFLQRSGAAHLHYDPQRESLDGWAAELVGGKLDGAPWRVGWNVRARSPGFDVNDVGYLKRTDHQHAETWAEWRLPEPTGGLRALSVTQAAWLDKTFGAEVMGYGSSVGVSTTLTNATSLYAGVMRSEGGLDPTLLRGGPAFRTPGTWQGWWGLLSDERRAVDVGLTSDWALRDENSRRFMRLTFTLRARPSPNLVLSLAPNLEKSLDDLQYVEERSDGSALLGRLNRRTYALTARASWALLRRLTLEAYAMPYISTGRYSAFYAVGQPLAQDYAARRLPTEYTGDPWVALAQLKSNLVLRWEHAPGSAAMLVWTHEQTSSRFDLGQGSVTRDLSRISGAGALDVVMLKLQQYL